MITKIPFNVSYPLKIFEDNKINFLDHGEREKLFKRNIHYYLFEDRKNPLLEQKHKIYHSLGETVLEYLQVSFPMLDVLNLSLFGSSTFLEKPGDYDFLAITSGDICLLQEPLLILNGENIQTGISIKGIENYLTGFKKKDNSVKSFQLEQIIDRTAISLFRRHIPLFGKDFINNENEFLKNAYAQVSDLINNAYDLFYLNEENHFSKEKRARKLMNRCYEATSYFAAVNSDNRISIIRKEIYLSLQNKVDLNESQKLFDKFVNLYEEKIL